MATWNCLISCQRGGAFISSRVLLEDPSVSLKLFWNRSTGGKSFRSRLLLTRPLANPEAKGKKVKADAAPIGTVLSDPEQNKVLGLIPNDAGKALLEHGRVPG